MKGIITFVCLFVSIVMLGQNEKERAEIAEYYKMLDKVPFDVDRYSKDEKNRTLIKAKELNVPVKITDSKGNEGELVRFDGDVPIYYTTYNDGAAITTRANLVYASAGNGYNLTGQGMNVGVWDQNHPRLTHNDFRDAQNVTRILAVDGPTPASLHSTHVTGTILSSGVNSNNFNGRGIAYESEGWIFDWSNDIDEMNQYASFGLLISNHSYGIIASAVPQWYFGAYVNDSRAVDNVCFNRPKYLPVYAAGNDRDNYALYNPSKNGNDLITGDKISKNALVVGAVNGVSNYINSSSVIMSSFSNYGPTDDFRIKPDVVAKGVSVNSTTSTSDTSYGFLNGTSMAAPGVTGSLLLVQQYFGSPYLNASTLKGLAIHTADEAGPAQGPDHMFGWGLLNTYKMVQALDNVGEQSIVEENSLANGAGYSLNVLALGTEPLKVTLSWTDRPGTVATNGVEDSVTPRLVNDLDVVLIKNGVEYYPWKLNKDWNDIYALKGNNDVDPVERVDIENPSGVYQVVVSHKGSLTGGNQNYSLIITGIDVQGLSVDSTVIDGQFYAWVNKDENVLYFQLPLNFDLKHTDIYDVNGRLVQQNMADGNHFLPLRTYQKGVYIVKFTDTEGKSVSRKIVL